MTDYTQYFRTIVYEYTNGKQSYSGSFKIEVENSGVPITPYNWEKVSGSDINSVSFNDGQNKLSFGLENEERPGLFIWATNCSNFSTANPNQTYTEVGEENVWSYTLEVIPPVPPTPPEPVFGFNLDGMVDKDYLKQY